MSLKAAKGLMAFTPEIRKRTKVAKPDLQTSSGSGQGTLRGGLTAVGGKVLKLRPRTGDAALVGPPQGGPTI
jgi:hypothetical protein